MNNLLNKLQRDLELKGFSPKTKNVYLKQTEKFLKHYNKRPEELGTHEIKEYLHSILTEKQRSSSAVNQAYSALKFFFIHTLDREWESQKIPRTKKTKRLPAVLDRDEIISLLNATENIKHKCILSLMYSAGLRVSEAASLRITDIDSKRMQIRVQQKYKPYSENMKMPTKKIMEAPCPAGCTGPCVQSGFAAPQSSAVIWMCVTPAKKPEFHIIHAGTGSVPNASS